MSTPIEDYALIGDCFGAGLVARSGAIDWLCVPRFDSPACFAALLGGPEQGRWLIAPATPVRTCNRRYRGETLVLETEFETDEGAVRLIDFLPPNSKAVDVVRIVEGLRGKVPMQLDLAIRFDYGSVVPWVTRQGRMLAAIAGPERLQLETKVELRANGLRHTSQFEVEPGERIPFVITFHPSHLPAPRSVDPELALERTVEFWQTWSSRSRYPGPYRDAVQRSLITLKALTYQPTGGVVAAPTTSLPERLGGERNWDYRYCWLRDATVTLYALLEAGYTEEAEAFRAWLLRAIAGSPSQLQIMYGIAGERRLTEIELPWLPGYEGSRPVRIGNAAHGQLQLDVFGELMDTMHQCRRVGLDGEQSWNLERNLLEFLESTWSQPDQGIWEVRGPRRHFTHSKVMAWVAFDRGVKAIEHFGLEGPLDRFRAARDQIHAQVLSQGYNAKKRSFVQSYGSDRLDASLLLIPLVGFLPATDPRVLGTIDAIVRELSTSNGLIRRYINDPGVDGLHGEEGVFLPCSFWLVQCLCVVGQTDKARALFERLLALRNDLGLLAEEYDVERGRLLGNFPQAYSHLALVDAAFALSASAEDAERDRAGAHPPKTLPNRAES